MFVKMNSAVCSENGIINEAYKTTDETKPLVTA